MIAAAILALLTTDTHAGVQHTALDVFRDACMTGQARIPENEVRLVKRDALTPAVRQWLSTWPEHLDSAAELYELTLPEGRGFLVVNDGRTGKYCSVASKQINYWDARVAIDQNPGYLAKISPSQRAKMVRMGHHRTISSLGYRITIRRLSDGFVTMTTYLPTGKSAN